MIATALLGGAVIAGIALLALTDGSTLVAVASALVIAAILALCAGVAYRFVVQPVERLEDTARRLADGDLTARAPKEQVVELAGLASTVNRIAEALEQGRAELEAVLDSTTDGMLMADLDGRVSFSNAAMDQIWRTLGMTERGSIWQRVAALALETGRADEYAPIFARIAADPEAVFQDEFAVPDRRRAFIGRTAPVRDASGALLGRMFVLREVTAEREAERLKDEFVSTVSHELRTPLTSIRGFVELLLAGEGGPVTAEQRRFLSVVDRNSERLVRLVGDLLLIAQLDAHTLRMDERDVDLAELAAEAVEAARPAAEEQRLRLELALADAPFVTGDRSRLAQLLDNLVSNALKFTPSGGVVEVSASSADGRARLAVRDTGPGMTQEEVARLFTRFYRTSQAVRQQVQGTGLGLAISMAIAKAHGGTIRVDSTPGGGSTFTVDLPIRQTTSST
jgi:signal transduction histidine kinase